MGAGSGMDRIRIAVLGGFEARSPSRGALRLPMRKYQALLTYLASPPGQTHPRDKLAALLWGDRPTEQARASLRQALYAIRKALGEGCLRIDETGVTLDPEAVSVDALELEGAVAAATPTTLERARDLYRGELLAGIALEEPPFEEWLVAERERLRERAMEGLAKLLTAQRTATPEAAIQTALKLVAIDPLLEPVHRTLMRLYAETGRRGAALRQYQACVAALERELGTQPEPDTKALYRELLREPAVAIPGSPRAAAGPARAAEHAPTPPGPADVPGTDIPLVGRRGDLDRLGRLIDAAWSGSGRMAGIFGDPGVGKSRLAAEVVTMAAQRGARVLVGRCSETDTRLPFLPWVDAFRAGRVLDDAALLEGLHPAWRSELGRLLPELGDSPAPPPERADPLHLFEAITRLVERLAQRDPLVILFEDWHWADEMSLRLLAFMGRRIRPWRVLLIGTLREEETASHPLQRQVGDQLVRDGLLVRLRLAPLSREETITLARHFLPPGTAAAVDEEVWRASEGNAFMTVETARMLAGRGPSDVDGPLLPGRVRHLVAGRLGRLSERSRGLVGLAAAIGGPLDFRLLQHAGDLSEDEAADAIEELVRRRILHQSGDGFDFTHDRIRAVAYEELLPPQRRILHRRVAESLEALDGTDAPASAAALAFHFREAGAWAKAAQHLGRFGEQAARGYAHADAAQAFQQALDALGREPASPERDRHQLALSWRRAHSLYFAGQWRESVATLAGQAALLARVDDPSLAGPWHAWAGHIHVRLGDFQRARASAQQAIEEAERAGDGLTTGKASGVLAFERFWSGRPREGTALAARSVGLLEGTTEHWWLGLAHFYTAFNDALLGRFGKARDALGRLRAISEAIDDNRLRTTAAWATGWTEALAGQAATAIASCEQALGLATDAVSAAAATAFLGHAYLEAGDGARAVPRLTAAVEEYTRLEFRPGQAWFGALLADAHRLEGRADAAAERATRAHALAREVGFPLALALAQRTLGRLAGASGARDEAARMLGGALGTFREMEAEFEGARTLLDLAATARAQGDAVRARGHEESARALFTRLGLPTSLSISSTGPGRRLA